MSDRGDREKRLQAYVSKELAERVERQAAREGRSVSSWIGRVLRTALQAEDELEEETRREAAIA